MAGRVARGGARSLPLRGETSIHRSTPTHSTVPMAEIDARGRAPGLRPWILGILLLAALAALGLWLLDERGDDRALDGVAAPAQ